MRLNVLWGLVKARKLELAASKSDLWIFNV